jgi:hypothetical protein
MKRSTALSLVLGSLLTWVNGTSAIPEVISTRSFSVSLSISESTWGVEVSEKAQSIRYSHGWDPGRIGDCFQLLVRRVELPSEKIDWDTDRFVSYLIQDDGLRFKLAEYRRKFRFTFRPDVVKFPAGTAYIYSSDLPVFKNPEPHYAAVALLLPPDYRARKVGYLILGDQLARDTQVTQAQIKFITRILEGLREKANKAPEPTTTSVTSPAAQEPRQP